MRASVQTVNMSTFNSNCRFSFQSLHIWKWGFQPKFRHLYFLRTYPLVVYWISVFSIKVGFRKKKNKYADFCPTLESSLCYCAGWFPPVIPILKCHCKHLSCQLIFMFDSALPNAGESIDWWTETYNRM